MYHVLFQRPHLQSSAERRDQCQTVAYLYHLQRVAERTNAQRTGRFERRETVPQTEAKLTAIRHTGRGISYRKEDRLLFLSGEFVIDIDHLPSPEETLHWRDTLFADNKLRPDLAFVSPSTTGVKLLVPYRLSPKASIEESFDKARLSAWEYLKWKYGLNADASNADLSRACFLCHDPSAKLRES